MDGEQWRHVPRSIVRSLGLSAGDEVDPTEIAERVRDLEPEHARERALNLVKYRERSSEELAQRLADDGFTSETVADVVSTFNRVALIDDERFAETYARQLAARGVGRVRAARELSARGVADPLLTAALDTAMPPDAEHDRALSLARRWARSTADAHKLTARLVRRGFTYDQARVSAAEALQSAWDPPDGPE
ncbi:MAG: RecX family transcriptional regulator [Anaerosomatales bacterium]|nr:RecX family transcriptional regulator [Anaerosomatales bacterium]